MFANKMKKLTEDAQEKQRIEAQAKAVAERIQAEKEETAGFTKAKSDMAEILKKIQHAASAGGRNIRITIDEWNHESKSSPFCERRAKAIKSELQFHGFKVCDEFDTMKPVGSDPMFYGTVYSWYLVVSW